MSVNYSVYGRESDWFNAAFQQVQIENKNKVAYFGENAKTLSQGVTNNKLSYSNPIDKTLSYCGLGSESALSHVAFFGYKDGARKLLEYNDRQVTNFAFFEKSTATNYTSSTFLNITELNRNMWVDDINTSFNNTGDLSPLTLVNPHNIILFAQIEGKAELSHSWTTVGLSSLPSVVAQYGWRYFRRVKITAYFGNVENNVAFSPIAGFSPMPANYKPLQISILDKYDCTEKNTSFYMYGGSINNDNTIFGFPSSNDISNDTNLLNLAFVTENAKPHLKIGTNNEGYIEYYDTMLEDIIKSIACFGLYFTGNQTTAANGDLTNSNMYIGLIDDDGVGRGRYLQGADTVNAPQAQSDFTDMHNIDYDPARPIDPNTYSKETLLPIAAIGSSYAYYIPVNSQGSAVMSMLEELANYPDPQNSWIFDRQFVFQEPIECIMAWRRIYLKPPELSSLTPHYLKIAWFVSSQNTSKGYVYSGECVRTLLAEKEIFPRYGDFKDYEPYSTFALYVPFCGIKELPTATFMGHTLRLYLNKNYRTGDIEILIFCDNIYWGNMHGNASIELPLSGTQSAEYIKRRMELQNARDSLLGDTLGSILGNAAGATISASHKNLTGAMIQGLSAGMNLVQGIDKYTDITTELEHTANKIVNIQKGSVSSSVLSIMNPYILIQRCVNMEGYNEELFAKSRGHATLENTYKNSLRGYTEATNPILDGIPCTDTERNLIVEALQEGCIFDYEE